MSDFDKIFGYFIPSRFDFVEEKKIILIDKQLAFYTINNNQNLITCRYKDNDTQNKIKLISDEHFFIHIENRMVIKNNRTK